ncbi:hypothetical protein [Pseudactinotalea sp.]|uniref:hypothetical protein n=1 Tax=Pseudactinotalea sp. TaxID=1926260 RepID=UPI003B3AC04A
MVEAPLGGGFPAALPIATAATWLWVGMVLAISFIEAPLKFRAPGVTLPIGLGIGRLVFRALNIAEGVFALVLLVCVLLGPAPGEGPAAVAILALLIQLLAVRPRLTRRTDAVLAGGPTDKRSNAHYWYVGLEAVKLVALMVVGIALVS